MGFFSKIARGVKKVFKKIGRGIKKAFKGFGKFMNKIGFAGQLAMMFLFPAGIGSLFTKGLLKLGTGMAALGTPSAGLFAQAAAGVGKILVKASKFITTVKSGFSSLTNGLKEFGKTALSKVGIKLEGASANFFGENSAWSSTKDGFAETGKLARGLKEGQVEITSSTSMKDLSNRVGVTQTDLKRLNPDLVNMIDKDGMLVIGDGQNLMVKTDLSMEITPETVQKSILSEDGVPSNKQGVRLDPINNNPEALKERGAFALDDAEPATFKAEPYMPDGKPLLDTQPVPDNVANASKIAEGFKGSYEAQQELGRVSPLGTEIKNVIKEEAVSDAVDFKRNWFLRGFDNVKAEVNPFAKGNFMQGTKNIMSVVGALTPEDDYSDDYRQKAGVQDFHTGYVGYTPPQDYNMFSQQGGGSFGYPALSEQLSLFNLYNPQSDTMLNSQTNTGR